MTQTTNLKLGMPEDTDYSDFMNPFNENMQKIDDFAGSLPDKFTGVAGQIETVNERINTATEQIAENTSSIAGVNSKADTNADNILALQSAGTTTEDALNKMQQEINVVAQKATAADENAADALIMAANAESAANQAQQTADTAITTAVNAETIATANTKSINTIKMRYVYSTRIELETTAVRFVESLKLLALDLNGYIDEGDVTSIINATVRWIHDNKPNIFPLEITVEADGTVTGSATLVNLTNLADGVLPTDEVTVNMLKPNI